jgi:hypothetical protein
MQIGVALKRFYTVQTPLFVDEVARLYSVCIIEGLRTATMESQLRNALVINTQTRPLTHPPKPLQTVRPSPKTSIASFSLFTPAIKPFSCMKYVSSHSHSIGLLMTARPIKSSAQFAPSASIGSLMMTESM